MSAATDTKHEHEVMKLIHRDSEAFFKALARPVRFNGKLSDALEEHGQRVTSK